MHLCKYQVKGKCQSCAIKACSIIINIHLHSSKSTAKKRKTNKQTNKQTKYKNSNEEDRNSDIKELSG